MNQFEKSEIENEIYIIPGTNQVIKHNYQQDIIDHFKADHDGLFVYHDHYVKVQGNQVVVEPADFYRQIDGKWTPIHEDGFSYRLDAMVQY